MKLKKKKGKEKLTIRWKYRKIGMHSFLNFVRVEDPRNSVRQCDPRA